MYCIYCGKWVEGEADTCPDCAAANSTPAAAPVPAAPVYAAPAAEPVYAAPAAEPVYATPTAEPVYAAPEAPVYAPPVEPFYPPQSDDTFRITTPEVPKKKSGKKVALLCVLAAVVAIAVLAVVFWDNIIGLFGNSYATPAEHLQKAEERALNDGIDAMTDAYGQLMSTANAGTASTATEMHLLLGDDTLELVETMLAQEGVPIGVDWLNDIMLTGTVNAQKDIYQATVGVGLGSTTLLTVDIIADIAQDQLWMGFPELSEDYLFFDSVEYLTGASLSDLMAASQVATEELIAALPAPEVLNSLMKKYGMLVIGNLQNVQEGTQTVAQGDITQEFTTLTAQIHLQDAAVIAEAVLNELKNDTQAQDILVNLAAYGYRSDGYYYFTEAELREELMEFIDEALESIAEAKNDPELDDGSYIELVAFLDDKDRICGRTLTLCDGEDREQVLQYMLVSSDEQFSLEAMLAEVSLSGTGTEKDGLLSGDFTLVAEDMEMFHVQLIDVDADSGKIRLRPSRYVLGEILDEMGISGGGIISNMNITLELEKRSENDSEYIGLMLLMNEELLAGLTVSTRPITAAEVRLPSNGVDINDDEAGMLWLQEMDFTVLMDNMGKAGVPSEIVQLVEYFAMVVQYGMYY